MTEKIPIAGPWVTELEVEYVTQAASEGWYDKAGLYVSRFEQAFAKYLGVQHAAAVPHCTAALHLAFAALGLKPGDEVVVPEATWIATAAPVTYVGATPVFADIDPITWCLSGESVRACLTPRTRAIVPVGLYGITPDMAELRQIAEEHDLRIIEDAAQVIGSRFRGQLAGSFGDAGAFSFHGSKTLTTGEGGMLVTNDSELFERALVLRDHGRTKTNFRNFYNTEVAFKYRMSSLQAAFGLAQLERVEQLIARKREIFSWYKQRLEGVPGLQLNAEPDGWFSTYWMTTVILDSAHGLDTQQLMSEFEKRTIDVRPFFHPLSSLPAFGGSEEAAKAKARNKVAYDIAPRAINLPSAMRLTEAQVDRVCEVLKEILHHA